MPVSPADRLRQIGIDLSGLLEGDDRDVFLHAFNDPDKDALGALEALVQRITERKSLADDPSHDRIFQLNLVLDILRTRDRAAAAQAEWDFAADLQLSGLPQDFPPFPDRTEFDLHAGMVTAKEVGGDLYDFFLLDENHLGFVVADAAGKGLPAAIFITLTRTLLRAAAEKLESPGKCLSVVNSMLCIDNPTLMFSTAFYGVLNTDTGEILYANAGHNPPYVLRTTGMVEALPGAGAMALGILEEMRYSTQSARLTPGETLVCFSDGVTEANDSAGALFGDARLMEVLSRQVDNHPTDILSTVVGEVDRYIALAPMADDVTLLIVRYNGLHSGASADSG